MPLERPTLVQLIAQTQSDALARANLEDPLRRADAMVYARVMAGLIHGLYGYAEWVAKQVIPDTAEKEFLDRWARIWLRVPRKAASVATGSATFTVQAGAVIPAGTVLKALDGQQYETTEDATGVAPSFNAPVRALAPGAAGNRTAGQVLTLVSPVSGVQPNATGGEISGGSEEESDEDLRARLLARITTPPQGGSLADYKAWTLEVPGVTRVWVFPGEMGASTVTVRFVRDSDASLIPDAGEVAAVQAYLDERKPVTAQVIVVPPVAVPLNISITGLVPDTPAVRASVEAELADLVRREAQPGGTLLLSRIRAAISAAAGETDYELVAPVGNVVAGAGQLTTMGVVSWV